MAKTLLHNRRKGSALFGVVLGVAFLALLIATVYPFLRLANGPTQHVRAGQYQYWLHQN
jgi:hypothetical protein